MGSVCQCATGPHDVLRWTSQLPAPARNGPELRRGGDGKRTNTQTHAQTHTHPEDKKRGKSCALMKSVNVSMNVFCVCLVFLKLSVTSMPDWMCKHTVLPQVCLSLHEITTPTPTPPNPSQIITSICCHGLL